MTKQQATWASQHDWFYCAHMTCPGCYMVTVLDSSTDELLEFVTFSELKQWAGY